MVLLQQWKKRVRAYWLLLKKQIKFVWPLGHGCKLNRFCFEKGDVWHCRCQSTLLVAILSLGWTLFLGSQLVQSVLWTQCTYPSGRNASVWISSLPVPQYTQWNLLQDYVRGMMELFWDKRCQHQCVICSVGDWRGVLNGNCWWLQVLRSFLDLFFQTTQMHRSYERRSYWVLWWMESVKCDIVKRCCNLKGDTFIWEIVFLRGFYNGQISMNGVTDANMFFCREYSLMTLLRLKSEIECCVWWTLHFQGPNFETTHLRMVDCVTSQ